MVQRELRAALAAMRPPVSAAVTTKADMPSYRVLYEDIKGDAELWRAIAILVLAGAAFAALNLTTRIVEAQRREIGIGMALGVRPRLLAARPLLFAAQVALIGVAFGAGVGYLVGIPLARVFAGPAAAAGMAHPVPGRHVRAGRRDRVRAAVRRGRLASVAGGPGAAGAGDPGRPLAARGNGLAGLLRWLRLPGRGYRQIPLRNVLRTPRRSALTLLGIAAAIATLVTIVGLLDTFRATLDTASAGMLRAAPGRVTVSLDSPYPAAGTVVAQVRALPQAGAVQAGLMVPGTVRSHGRSVDVAAEVLQPEPSGRRRCQPAAWPADWCCPARPPPTWASAWAAWSPSGIPRQPGTGCGRPTARSGWPASTLARCAPTPTWTPPPRRLFPGCPG